MDSLVPGVDAGGDASFVSLDSLKSGATGGTPLSRLRGQTGRQYWRSLQELAGSPEFQRQVEREFPGQAPGEWSALSRREFVRLMGASLALAGVGGCAYQRAEKIVPYVEQPEGLTPGKSLFFTTAFSRSGYGTGLLGESAMGRPVKLEGNPDHPASLGSTDVFAQASLLELYDPDRSQGVRRQGIQSNWEALLGALLEPLASQKAKGGAGLRILTGAVTSPTLERQLRELLKAYPAARICQHEPVGRGNAVQGSEIAFGTEVQTVYHLDRAERILALDSNFLVDEPGSVRYARDFAATRRVRHANLQMSRLYVVESTPTVTGATADHRVSARSLEVEAVARRIARALGIPSGETPALRGVSEGWISAVVRDLQQHRGKSVVIPGETQPARVHALCHAINAALGAAGSTVSYRRPVEGRFPGNGQDLVQLTADLNAGKVDLLLILGCNPVYDAPGDLEFDKAIQKAGLRVHLGLHDDETAALCQWHAAESHYLESWSDLRAHDGTAGIVQPLITPLYATRSRHEFLALLLGSEQSSGYDIVRATWRASNPAFIVPEGASAARARQSNGAFEKFWHGALQEGVVPNSASPSVAVTLRSFSEALPPLPPPAGLEIQFRPDPTVWDGRFSNNGWMQELPKPLTSLTWDNAAIVSPGYAAAQGLSQGSKVRLNSGGREVLAAIAILPGHPDDAVTLTLGFGRTRAGRIGNGVGANAYRLRSSNSPWTAPVEVSLVRGKHPLVTAQQHFSQLDRELVIQGTLAQYAEDAEHPHFMPHQAHSGPLPSLYPQQWSSDAQEQHGREPGRWEGEGYNGQPIPAWGMVIDLTACMGCNACVVACQAENNIPVIGKDQVAMHRQMHWIRIDTYFEGDPANPDSILFEPMACQHCEKAPCEPVCPVEATTHSAEGLNEMTYNRCIGTRYCSNNCPYKARRFNFLQYSDQITPTIQMMKNPDVTVRSRGVMEKCTFCVQRITDARIQAEKEERPIRDGDIVTACQQVCPTQAITFGNLNDERSHGNKGSRVRQLKTEPHNYGVLTELNTRPRTSYLARIRNPNPEISGGGRHTGPSGHSDSSQPEHGAAGEHAGE